MNKLENFSNSPGRFEFPIITGSSSCCAMSSGDSPIISAGLDQSFVTGGIQTPIGLVPHVSSRLNKSDYRGTWKARFGVGRMDYRVDPGLYALSSPDSNSPVLVTANYKMSFDRLRSALDGRNAWILVLDTKGINVWCAAGHGTFGTEELVHRMESCGVRKVVSHKKIILPQLGAPGVAAHIVKKLTGFKVHYGPVRAEDLSRYLDSGLKTTPDMRLITFPLKDRAVLIPIEVGAALKPFLIIAFVFFLLSGIGGPSGFWANMLHYGLFAVLALLTAIISGAVLNPLLLPYLPGRAFSIKGFTIGLFAALILLYWRGIDFHAWSGMIEALAWLLIMPAISAYLAMNFTGCSTYTSLSGVKKEMRWALPAQISAGAAGLLIWIASRLIA